MRLCQQTVNYMAKTYNSFLKNYDIPKSAEKSAAKTVASTSGTGEVSAQDMTMGEYKQYIYDKISKIPINPTQSGYHWNIEITDEGFEAMKNDSEYEAYVLDVIRINFSGTDPFRTQNYSILHIGASKEESYGIGWCTGDSESKESDNSFWERKAEREKRLKEQYERFLKNRVLAKRWQQERLNAELIAEKAEKSRLMKSWLSESRMTQASAAYEANVMVEPAESGSFGGAAAGDNV